MTRNTIGVKTRVKERKTHNPQRGVVVSTDPKQPGRKQKWLVLFDGQENAVPRSSQQLLNDDSKDDESDCEFPLPDSPLVSEAEEDTDTDTHSEEDWDKYEVDEDVLEHEENEGDIENPFFSNAAALEKADEHKKKFEAFLKQKKNMIEKARNFVVTINRKTKIVEGDKVKWVSVDLKILYLFTN